MKLRISIFSVAVFSAFAALVCDALPDAGTNAPDFVLKSLAGNNIRLSEYRGEVVMVAFWSSWCGDCRDHLQHAAAIHRRYRDAGLAFLAVSLDRDRPGAQSARDGIEPISVLHDADGEVGRLYDVDELPMLIVIDRAGTVREVFSGYRRGDEAVYLERIRALLRE